MSQVLLIAPNNFSATVGDTPSGQSYAVGNGQTVAVDTRDQALFLTLGFRASGPPATPAGALTLTDNTTTVTPVTDLVFAGAVVSGVSPNGTITVAGTTLTAGAGIAITGANTVANSGVLALVAGTGISITGSVASETIAATGIQSLVASTGISIVNGNTVQNTGIVSVTAGAGINFTGTDTINATLVAGAGINITGTNTIAATGANLTAGPGIAINSGTIASSSSAAATGTASGTITISGTAAQNDIAITMPAGGGTVTLAANPTAFLPVRAHIKQGATAGVIALNSGFVFPTSGGPTSFTLTPTANVTDMVGFISQDGTHYRVDAVAQGYTS